MSDTYYCAKTGRPFEADWDVECECTTCLPLDSGARTAREKFREFQRLWSDYRAALAQPFGATKAEDEAIRQRVDAAFDQLNNLAKETV